MTWLFVTLIAIAFQTVRNATQKHLKTKLTTIEVSWSRVLFAAPFLIITLIYLVLRHVEIFSNLSLTFYLFAFCAGVAQILATLFMVECFARRNFSVGIAYSKSDTIQVAILAFLFLGESLAFSAILAIAIGMAGIIFLSPPKLGKSFLHSLLDESALFGIFAGLCFAITTIFMKKAMILVDAKNNILPAIFVFVIYVLMQNVMYFMYQICNKNLKNTLNAMLNQAKLCSIVGICSMIATLLWLIAFYLQSVAFVKVVSQLEIILSFFITHKFFKESIKMREKFGITLLLTSVLLIILH